MIRYYRYESKYTNVYKEDKNMLTTTVKNVSVTDVIPERFLDKLGLEFIEQWYLYYNKVDIHAVNSHIKKLRDAERVINIDVPRYRCIDENDYDAIWNFFNKPEGFNRDNYYFVNQWFSVVKCMLIDSLAQTFNIPKESVEQYREKVVNFDRIVMNEIAFTLAQSRALGTFLNCEECDEILKWIAPNNHKKWNTLIDAQVVPEAIKEYLHFEIETEKPVNDTAAQDPDEFKEVKTEEPQMRNAIKFEKLIKDPQNQKKEDEDTEQKAC